MEGMQSGVGCYWMRKAGGGGQSTDLFYLRRIQLNPCSFKIFEVAELMHVPERNYVPRCKEHMLRYCSRDEVTGSIKHDQKRSEEQEMQPVLQNSLLNFTNTDKYLSCTKK